jgi:glycosyltransferase involved in cell wall biosynthesis
MQTWSNIEIIVVNDGSTDDSRQILERYASRGVRVIDQPNRGQTAALNRCVSAARGDFIQYLDADDLLAPDKIELQMRRLADCPGCIAMAEWARFRDEPAYAKFKPDETWQDMNPVDWLVTNWKDGGGMMYPAMWLLPRDIIDAIGPWREELTLANDTEYFTRALLAGRRVLFCQNSRTYYRSSVPGSLSSLKSTRGWQSGYDVLILCEKHLLDRLDAESTRCALSALWQNLAYASYPYAPGLANKANKHAKSLFPIEFPPAGSPLFRVLAKFLGWRFARRLQYFFRDN